MKKPIFIAMKNKHLKTSEMGKGSYAFAVLKSGSEIDDDS